MSYDTNHTDGKSAHVLASLASLQSAHLPFTYQARQKVGISPRPTSWRVYSLRNTQSCKQTRASRCPNLSQGNRIGADFFEITINGKFGKRVCWKSFETLKGKLSHPKADCASVPSYLCRKSLREILTDGQIRARKFLGSVTIKYTAGKKAGCEYQKGKKVLQESALIVSNNSKLDLSGRYSNGRLGIIIPSSTARRILKRPNCRLKAFSLPRHYSKKKKRKA